MTVQGTNAVENNLQKVWEELEAARIMQDDWMNYGVDFVDLYVEDAGGDWLEKWGKCEEELELIKIKKVDIEAVKTAIDISSFQQTKLLEIALNCRYNTSDYPDRPEESPAWQEVKYKRLSLLGGAIFGAVVTDYLYREYPELAPDAISTLKARLADPKKLAEFAQNLKLNQLDWRVWNRKKTDESEYNRLLSETFEALFGAIYLELDRDFFRGENWLIQHLIEPNVSQHLDLTQRRQMGLENEVKRREILGADILDAIAIDYLYHRFPERNSSQLTRWKNMLVAKEIFPKDFKAKLGSHYLELESNFSRTRDWLVDNFIKSAVDELLEESDTQPEYLIDSANPDSLPELVSRITDKKWKNEFVRVVSILQPADEILLLMQQKLDSMAAKDETLQQLLIWANHKSQLVQRNFKPVEIRAFYVALVCVLDLALTRVLDPSLKFDRSKVRKFRNCLAKAGKKVEFADVNECLKFACDNDVASMLVGILALDIEPELKQMLAQFQTQMPDLQNWKKWRKECGCSWLAKFKTAIGYNRDFRPQQKTLLKQYYYAQNLLVECLNSDNCQVTPAVRQKIEDKMLLLSVDLKLVHI
ncbi:ribonuclease III [Microcoleus vaginatus PCC 9802]|uniref:NACHT C-terminal helical domain 2-containing protein n=1 Tax=Microcoleus vaginatus TaxID=119532 RepID=UPI00020D1D50|nr:ribonuclease III [Microcoleus vaginatus FGP-2]UNU18867.1 ribonuclease III [Microcoleus vaginatus PCC 9802]